MGVSSGLQAETVDKGAFSMMLEQAKAQPLTSASHAPCPGMCTFRTPTRAANYLESSSTCSPPPLLLTSEQPGMPPCLKQHPLPHTH